VKQFTLFILLGFFATQIYGDFFGVFTSGGGGTSTYSLDFSDQNNSFYLAI